MAGTPQQVVEGVVRSQILDHWEAQDDPEHLRTIRNRLMLNSMRPQLLLQLYQQILTHGDVAINNSRAQIELRFSGLVIQRQGTLQVFNRIYSRVFDQASPVQMSFSRSCMRNAWSCQNSISVGLRA